MALTRQRFLDVSVQRKADDVYRFIISTPARDRDNDIVDPLGLDTTAYKQNPVVLWMHNTDRPIGQAIRLSADAHGIVADMRFGSTPFAREIRTLVDDGVLRATSIGFLPIASQPLPDGGQRFTKAELHEFSIVSVPSNREALRVRGLLHYDQFIDVDLGGSDELDVDPDTFKAALLELPALLRGELQELIRAETRRAIARAKGRIPDDLGGDPAPAQRRHHRHVGDGEFSEEDVMAALKSVLPALYRAAIADGVATGLARAKGRVD